MKPYEITSMIIDDDFDSEEYASVEFTHNNKEYSITLKKADLELINTWIFEDGTSIPANLSDTLIESIREEVKRRI